MDVDFDLARAARRLKNIALFGYLSEQALEALAGTAVWQDFAPGDALFYADDAVDSLFILRSGWAKIITHDATGQELVISHVGPGQAIGDISLLDGQPYLVSVVALVPVKAMVIRRAAFMDWMKSHPTYALDVLRGLADKVRMDSTYVRKAIEWSNKIAQGDYALPMEEINTEHTSVSTRARPDEAVVAEFLAAFHTMIQGVKTREDHLKQQIQELSIQIDHAKVDEEVDQLTQSNFFKNLKEARDRLRKPRSE